MVENLLLEGIIIGGGILGGVGRMMLPYLRKLAAAEGSGQPVPYQHRYTFTTVFSVIVSTVVGMTLFPQLLANTTAGAPLASVFITSFLTSWGSNSLFGNVIATGNGTTPTPTTPTAAKPETT